MSGDSSKLSSTKDMAQVLKYAFNDADMTISTSGFLDGKVGHRMLLTSPSSTIDINYYYDEVLVLPSISLTSSNTFVVPSVLNLSVGMTVLLDVGISGIPALTTIQSINVTTNTITLSAATTVTGTYTVHIANLLKILKLSYSDSSHTALLEAARIL